MAVCFRAGEPGRKCAVAVLPAETEGSGAPKNVGVCGTP
jgi:hypothetical protein